MLRRFRRHEKPVAIDAEIDAVLDAMKQAGPTSEKYPKYLVYLNRLNEIKTSDRRETVSPDTVWTVVGNFVVVLLIVTYEQKHVITSKAMNHLMRLKAAL